MTTRDDEIAEYVRQYATGNYGMGPRRRADVQRILSELPPSTLLDVSTGRGEALRMARAAGHFFVRGTEVVPELLKNDVVFAQAHSLPFPDASFGHVTCFDVMEHLVEEDIEPALREMRRVARRTCTVSASSRPSIFRSADGTERDLHISKRPAAQWEALFKKVWGPHVRFIGKCGGSGCWQLTI